MTLSPRTATPYPVASDAPDGPAQIGAAVLQLEKFTIGKYASSAARDAAIPSPTEGDTCYRTDTHTYEGYTGAAWITIIELVQPWTTYTCTLTNLTLGVGGTNTARWMRMGSLIYVQIQVVLGSSGFSVGTGPTFSLPVTAENTSPQQGSVIIGHSTLFDNTGVPYAAATLLLTTTTMEPRVIGTNGALTQVGAAVPITWAASDRLTVHACYRAA